MCLYYTRIHKYTIIANIGMQTSADCPVKKTIEKIYGSGYNEDIQYTKVGGVEYALDDTSYATNVLMMEFARFRLSDPSLSAATKFYLRTAVIVGVNRYDYINRILFGVEAPKLHALLERQFQTVSLKLANLITQICKSKTCTIGALPPEHTIEEFIKSPVLLHDVVNQYITLNNMIMIDNHHLAQVAPLEPLKVGIKNDSAPRAAPKTVEEYLAATSALVDFAAETGQFLTHLEKFHRDAHHKLNELFVYVPH